MKFHLKNSVALLGLQLKNKSQFNFNFDKKINKITLIESNHKIAWTIKNDIPFVPVKVTINDDNKVTSIPPSQLGIKVYSKYPKHPFIGPFAGDIWKNMFYKIHMKLVWKK